MTRKTYIISDMHCSSCVMRLEALEDSLPGVQRVSASYQKQTLQVDFDEQTLSEEQFLAAVEQLGYHPQQK